MEPGQGAYRVVTRMASPPLSWVSYALESQHNPQKEKVPQGDQCENSCQVDKRQDLMQKHKEMKYSLHLKYYGVICVLQMLSSL